VAHGRLGWGIPEHVTALPVDGDPIAALRAVAFYLERERAETYRVKAYRSAAERLAELDPDEVASRARNGTLTDLKGVGKKTAAVVTEVLDGGTSATLADLEARHTEPVAGGAGIRVALRGDCHTHSTWSDGGSDILEMARTARDLGHEWMVLTDHSENLTVANGLTPERRRRQFDVIAEVNEQLAPFRLLRGIEVDILEDGDIDAPDDLLEELDLVVASVHSKLRAPSELMTARMVAGVSHPLVDVLGHCTGRLVTGGRGTRPPSTFDAEAVFDACVENGVAVEINSRPERLDPPRPLLRQALAAGCEFVVDTDAHAPGQLDWQPYGCERAEECEVPVERIVNTRSVDDLAAWRHISR
jgi:putative hydrolase